MGGGKKEVSVTIKGSMKGPCDGRNVLYLDSIHASILVVILSYNFSRCYHRGKLG